MKLYLLEGRPNCFALQFSRCPGRVRKAEYGVRNAPNPQRRFLLGSPRSGWRRGAGASGRSLKTEQWQGGSLPQRNVLLARIGST